MIRVDRYRCAYCGACVTICPEDAIDLAGMWLEIREDTCNSCKVCVKICPVGALEFIKAEVEE
ncbi:MAG: 4Fe-4S binding protein [Candidatus Methanospirareceae archaeon]